MDYERTYVRICLTVIITIYQLSIINYQLLEGDFA